jgi:hypothetical protein
MTRLESTPCATDPAALLAAGREAIRLREVWDRARRAASEAHITYSEAKVRELLAGDAHLSGRLQLAEYLPSRRAWMAALDVWESAQDREAEAFDAYSEALSQMAGREGGRKDGVRDIVHPVYGAQWPVLVRSTSDDPTRDHLRDLDREFKSEGR